jgi:putative ABC transport system substrate-binding protein
MPVVGFLNSQSPATFGNLAAAFRQGLKEQGFIEGQNFSVEYRWAEGRSDRLPELAADLVRHRVAAIAATGGPAPALAAKGATTAIPIVFDVGGDPVKLGLVASVNRPGGNVTGIGILTSELDGKRLGLLHQLDPRAGRIAVLINPKNPNAESQKKDVIEASQKLGEQITILNASTGSEIDGALSASGIGDAASVLVGADPFFDSRRTQIVERIAALKVPAIYELRDFVDAGGLISYGISIADAYRQVGVYIGRILKGAKPADLPVVQSSRFELAINLKTAMGLGLSVPQLLLAQADEVIE